MKPAAQNWQFTVTFGTKTSAADDSKNYFVAGAGKTVEYSTWDSFTTATESNHTTFQIKYKYPKNK